MKSEFFMIVGPKGQNIQQLRDAKPELAAEITGAARNDGRFYLLTELFR